MKKFKKVLALLLTAALVASVFAACRKSEDSGSSEGSGSVSSETAGGESKDNNGDDSKNEDSGEEVKTIRVGTGNSYNPACYLNEKGELDGYDPAILKEIDELLPQYEFTYETFDFQNVVIALQNNKIDLAAHQYEWNEEREANYLFGEEGYTVFDEYLWVIGSDKNEYKSLEDFAGKTFQASAGSNLAFFLENWNKENPDKAIKLDYTTTSTTEEAVSYYLSGKWAGLIVPKKDIDRYNENYTGCDFRLAFDEPLYSSNTYFLYRKDEPEETALKEAVDGALKQLKESGRLAEISTEYWGGDYTESNAAYDYHKES